MEKIAQSLLSRKDFWKYWGFTPWEQPPFSGVCREQHFVKKGFLGPMAEFHAWEAIIWDTGTQPERESLWRSINPRPDVLTQRFLFLLDEPWKERRVRSFWLGLKGYVEFFACKPGCTPHSKVQDLAGLVELVLALDDGQDGQDANNFY